MLPLVAIAEMYALKILIGVLSGEKPRASPGVFSPATPQVVYSGIHFCRRSVPAISSVVRRHTTLNDLGDRHGALPLLRYPQSELLTHFLEIGDP